MVTGSNPVCPIYNIRGDIMCPYCDYNSYENMIFKEPLTNEWYLKVMGTGWDYYNDDWNYENVYDIKYCPFCGRNLDINE